MAAADGPRENVRVAVLGTGIMGSAMARNLISAGLRTTVWDRSPEATAPLFQLSLFRIRAFTAGSIAGSAVAIARGWAPGPAVRPYPRVFPGRMW